MKKVFEFFALLLDDGTDKQDKNFREFVCLKPNEGFYCMHEVFLPQSTMADKRAIVADTSTYKSDLELCDAIKISPEILISLN